MMNSQVKAQNAELSAAQRKQSVYTPPTMTDGEPLKAPAKPSFPEKKGGLIRQGSVPDEEEEGLNEQRSIPEEDEEGLSKQGEDGNS
ncbi:hypothetical protein AAFF_G00351610 [Aldrovandia affinis]|uniref:Uncharacterized protein n=1 Tax=Aldrovandia affinis TaxID=143900 RepID=A0AAD7SIY0_9TELE|nr:hypothetical protein AAFF_G00351610 [Aldrovandia affinis]